MNKTIQRISKVARLVALSLCFLATLATQAQVVEAVGAVAEVESDTTALFGYLSYNDVIQSMPDMALLKKRLADQRSQYEAELKRAEDEFNKKYEDFLEGQRQFAPSIYKKRQAELTDLMQKNMAFKAEAQRQLQEDEAKAMAPLKAKLAAAIAKVAKSMGLAFVLNTDGDAVPYVDPILGTNITEAVTSALQ